MAVTVTENLLGRRSNRGLNPFDVIPYLIEADAGETPDEMMTEAWEQIPKEHQPVPGIYVPLTGLDVIEEIDESSFKVAATYNFQQREGESSYAFEIGGETKHITQSISTRGSYGAQIPAEASGVIGFDGKKVDGVDIIVPAYKWAETHYFPAAAITPAYKAILADLTGKINNAPFRGFDDAEVRFDGASGVLRGYDAWELQFRFACQRTRQNFTVGQFVVAEKKGWDYMWVRYEDDDEDSTDAKKIMVRQPIGVAVEQVYEERDFTLLGLPA